MNTLLGCDTIEFFIMTWHKSLPNDYRYVCIHEKGVRMRRVKVHAYFLGCDTIKPLNSIIALSILNKVVNKNYYKFLFILLYILYFRLKIMPL